MHFSGGEFTDNARVRQNVVPQSSRVQGFIREVRFADFQQVKKGDTLAIIEDAEFRLRLAQAETDLIRAEHGSQGTASSIVTTKTSMTVTEAGIESARVQMENAMREDTRFKKLLSQDAVTRQQYDKVHTGYLSAKAAYEQAVRSRQMQSAVVAEQGITFPFRSRASNWLVVPSTSPVSTSPIATSLPLVTVPLARRIFT